MQKQIMRGVFVIMSLISTMSMAKVADPPPLSEGNVVYSSHANYVEAHNSENDKLLWHTVLFKTVQPDCGDPALEQDAQWNIIATLELRGDLIYAKNRHGQEFFLQKSNGQLKPE